MKNREIPHLKQVKMFFSFSQFGKWLVLAGGILVLSGLLLMLLSRLGLFRLPGDIELGSKNWRIYLPIGSCILISIMLTLIVWVITLLKR